MTFEDIDHQIQSLSDSSGPDDPEYERAVQSLVDLGEPAIRRFMQVEEGAIAIPWNNRFGLRAVLENRQFAFERLARQHVEAFLEAVKEGDRLEVDRIVWVLGSLPDERAQDLLIAIGENSDDPQLRWVAAHWLFEHGCQRAHDLIMKTLSSVELASRFMHKRDYDSYRGRGQVS
jgi:hypothetical protein